MLKTNYGVDKNDVFSYLADRHPFGAVLIACALTFAAATAATVFPVSAAAETLALDGAWTGGGSVMFPSGAKETARCRANFKKRGAESYLVSARCASASGKVEQSALLTYVGGNRYSGSFFNTEYKVDGTITVTVSGRTQNVSITSPAGSSAYFKLSR
jgi:hypothetical protein